MDNVGQLIKLAKERKSDAQKRTDTGNMVGAAAIASGAGAGSKEKILGYHKVLHGTNARNAKKIKKKGYLDPRRGGRDGSGNSKEISPAQREMFKKNSAGKVHVTKQSRIAKSFAGHASGGSDAKGKVLKGTMSHKQWERASRDRDLGFGTSKSMGATTRHRVNVSGSHKYATKKNMKRYLSTASGKARFKKGVLGAAVSAASSAYVAKKGVDKLKERARAKKEA